jgi:DeoR family glycerol-3-phosphate regulon repressor
VPQNLSPRQLGILEVAREDGSVSVDKLANKFSVTAQTIRKNINDLCQTGHLQRVHGGAIHPTSTVNMAYHTRRVFSSDAKRRIGGAAAKLIPNGASVIVNIGTSIEQVALALRQHEDLLVITNNLNVALILQESAGVEVIVTGGKVRKADAGIVGAEALEMIKQFRADYAVIGAAGIDEDGTLLDFDFQEVQVAQAILTQARKRILVADYSKFSLRAPVKIGHISDLDFLITDQLPDNRISDICSKEDVELVLA